MIVGLGPRRIAVLIDETTAAYGVQEGFGDLRRYVEVRVAAGGMTLRAALGGTFRSSSEPFGSRFAGRGKPM